MDHVEDSEGTETAFRSDFEFDIGSGWMKSLKVGARIASREQDVRWTNYNWQNVSNNWTGQGAPYYNLDQHDPANLVGAQPNFTGYPENHYVTRSFNSDFFGGGYLSPNTFVFANMDMLQNQQLWADSMGAQALGFNQGAALDGNAAGWDPICSNNGDRGDEVPGTCFTPAEFSTITEDTQALYVQLNYGGEDASVFGVPVSGNVGVRFVSTQDESTGGLSFPTPPGGSLNCAQDTNNAVGFTLGCVLSPDEIAYMTSEDLVISEPVGADHEHALPSFNAKFELTDELLLRFAASRAMARPDMGNLRNYTGLSVTLPRTNDPNHPLWTFSDPDCVVPNGATPTADPDCATVRWTGNAQNPVLKPIIADQMDLSLEWYFADVGSASVTLFDKHFDDYIQSGKVIQEFTNEAAGLSNVHEVSRPLNGAGASIDGYEAAFQRFFDFLPAPFDGLGVQFNYTHINNNGVESTNVTSAGGGGDTITGQAPDVVSVNRLEGLSDDSYTTILMYENETISSRIAYSWRSEYMVTAIDCCVAYPIWNDEYGQVDASLAWHVSDNFEFHVQGSNLTNEETRLFQQVSNAEDGGLLLPNAWFQNDRRYTIGFRYRM
jgi:TonB-dependent receptor